jgi:hypothetical protein
MMVYNLIRPLKMAHVKHAPLVVAKASTLVITSPTPQLKSASFGMCPAASSHSASVGRR